jgi:hypothetical protein
MRSLILLLAACSISAGTNEKEVDLLSKLSSSDVAVRAEAARSLHAERIGDLDPDLAIRAVLVAVQDSDPYIRRAALGGLGLVTAALIPGNPNPKVAAFAEAIEASRELRPMLERIIAEDPDIDIAVGASLPFMTLYGSDPAAEKLLLDRADREPDANNRTTLMSNLEPIDGEETADRLNRYLDDAPVVVQLKAAHLLLSGQRLRAGQLADVLRIIESPEAFADPKLVRALPRLGVPPENYLPRLLAVQSRLEEELQNPRDERTLAIYNDAYWRQPLDEAIAVARLNTKPEQP